jgi:hypothetical protein
MRDLETILYLGNVATILLQDLLRLSKQSGSSKGDPGLELPCGIRGSAHNPPVAMLTNPHRLVAAFALTFVVGGVAGYLIGDRTPTPAVTNREQFSNIWFTRTEQHSPASTVEDGGSGSRSSSQETLPNVDLPRRVLAAVRSRDYFRRRYEIYAVGQELDRETIRAAMEATQQFSDEDREHAQYPLIARWLELDPAAAYQWVNNLPAPKRRTNLMREFFHSLGLKDPTTALSFLAQYKSDPNRSDDFTYSVFEAWSAHDPAAAVDAAINLQKIDTRQSAVGVALGRWAKKDPQGALARVAQLPDGESRRQNLRTVLREWAEEDPQGAANHALSLPEGKERNDALAAALSGAAAKDRDTAMRLVEQLPRGAARTETLRQVVGDIASSEPKFAAELVLEMAAGQQRNSVHQVSHNLARRDREAALDWAGKLTSSDARRSAMQSILQIWASDDPKAAAEYCVGHPTESPDLIGNAVAGWVRNDASGALAWVRSLPDGAQREAALVSGLSALAASDPGQAANLATTMLNGNKQSQALGSIAGAWATKDPAAAAAWASKLTDGSARTSAESYVASAWVRQDPAAAAAWASRMQNNLNVLPTIAREWATQDPTAAARWLDTMPSGDVRDSAVHNFSSAVADSDPEGAAAWAATISQQSQRDSAIIQIVQQWKRTDPKAAAAWLQTTPALSGEARERILRWND